MGGNIEQWEGTCTVLGEDIEQWEGILSLGRILSGGRVLSLHGEDIEQWEGTCVLLQIE